MISKRAIIYPYVHLGKNCIVEDFVIIGAVPRGYASGDMETVIGDNAVIRSLTVIYAGNKIGSNFHTGNKTNIRELNEIGDDVSIGTLSVVEHHVKIGNSVRIHTQAFIPELTILEDGCWIGPNAVITNLKYPQSVDAKKRLNGTRVKKYVVICANSTILPGLVIGEHALVGAGSVVCKDVADNSVVVGNPAKPIKDINQLPYIRKTL